MRRVSGGGALSGRIGKTVFAFFACIAFAACGGEQKPTRSECIVGFRMGWPSYGAQEDIINAMADAWPKGAEKKAAGLDPLAAMATPRRNRNELYVQFSSDCERKWEMADRLIGIWRTAGIDLPKFERMTEPIIPSPYTIDVFGPSWRD
jgi:hypothetical protein